MRSHNFLFDSQLQMNKDFDSQDPDLFDTVFEIDGKKLYAHKYRLSFMSTTFKAMLSDRWNSNKNEPIQIKDYSFENFKEFIKFIYSGECNISEENVFIMLELAEFYQIKHLKEMCDAYFTEMEISFDNVFKIFEISRKYSLIFVKYSLETFVEENFSNFIKQKQFLNADKLIIEEFCTLNQKWVKPEKMFQAIYEWAEHQATKKQLKSRAKKFEKNDAIKVQISPFLPKIEFKKMKLSFLIEYVVKRGFVFSNNELNEILEYVNRGVKVKVTNSYGESISGNLPYDSEAIEIIKSLKDTYPDIVGSKRIWWETNCKEILSTPSTIKKRNGVKWYLICSSSGNIGVKEFSAIIAKDYLLAEMAVEEGNNFGVFLKCNIEIE